MSIKFATAQAVPETIQLVGGWYTLGSELLRPPGTVRDSQNFEAVPDRTTGGYALIGGYERFDGRPKPSNASFSIVQLLSFTNVPTTGQTLTGGTSGSTGVIVAIGVNFLILTKLSASFLDNETVSVGATPIGTTTAVNTILSPLASAQYAAAAADIYRADIEEVFGEGPIQGVIEADLDGTGEVTYAFRSDGLVTKAYKSTTGGWVNVPFDHEISFTAGGAAVPAEGSTLTRGGVTATIKRVVLQDGAWSSNDASGRLIIGTPSGGNFTAGAATITGGINVTLSGAQTAITFAPGGLFEFDIGRFKVNGTKRRIYGCDGVNRGFEFDGTVMVPITTGTASDTPKHVKIHKDHLFFAFDSSAINSGIGRPYEWTADSGALETSVGDTITNFISQGGNEDTAVLGITTSSNTHFLYGKTAASWHLVSTNKGIGGTHYSAQQLEQGYWFSHAGVVNIRTTDTFGDFMQSSLTAGIPEFIAAQRARPMFSVTHHTKHQYRVYFNDGQALYTTIVNGKPIGNMRMIFPRSFSCGWGSKTSGNEERVLVGDSSNGYVYEMDIGSSFDGELIDAYLTLNKHVSRGHRAKKKYSSMSFELQGSFYATFQLGYTLTHNSPQVLQPGTSTYESSFSGAPAWDSFVWDAFTWDGATVSPTESDVRGTGFTFQPTIRTSSNYVKPFTISSITLHVTPLRNIKKMGR